MTTNSKRIAAQLAATTYRMRVAEIARAFDRSSRDFAVAMTAACADYERAMVDDIGLKHAARLGAGMVRL